MKPSGISIVEPPPLWMAETQPARYAQRFRRYREHCEKLRMVSEDKKRAGIEYYNRDTNIRIIIDGKTIINAPFFEVKHRKKHRKLALFMNSLKIKYFNY